jgi:hypothetical protein
LLPLVRFNASPRVLLGMKRLRSYRRRRNDALGTYTTPLHDDASHASDAFGEYAINARVLAPKPPVTVRSRPKEEEVLMTASGYIVSNFTVEDILQRAIREAEQQRLRRTL